MRNNLEALAHQIVQGLTVGGKGAPFRPLDIKNPDIQPALGGNLGIVLAQGTGSGVPWIGKERLPLELCFSVQVFKNLFGHEDLATHDERRQSLRQAQRDRTDGLEVLCHILSHKAVAPGSATDKNAVFIFQSHRQAVHLGLHVVFYPVGQGVPHPLVEFTQLLQGEDILKALQRHPVDHFVKALGHLTSHPLRGRVRTGQLRMGGLQLLQTTEFMVEVVIAHGGVVQYVVFIVGLLQLTAQVLNFLDLIHERITPLHK